MQESDEQLSLALLAGGDVAIPKLTMSKCQFAPRITCGTKISAPRSKHHALTYIHSWGFQKLRQMSIHKSIGATGLDDGQTDDPISPGPRRDRSRVPDRRKVKGPLNRALGRRSLRTSNVVTRHRVLSRTRRSKMDPRKWSGQN